MSKNFCKDFAIWSFAQKASTDQIAIDINCKTLSTYLLLLLTGTLCDLSGRPRLTRVRYVCYVHGKHEIYSFKETSTCEYEIIVLSPLLCEHPQFKPKEASENIINCLPVGDAPKKPRSLLAMEVESLKLQHQSVRLANNVRI